MSNQTPTSFVMECINRYEESFPDDWIESLNWSSEDKAIESFASGRQFIVDFVDYCFVRIGKSLLCGEYIVDRAKFDKVKKSFEKYWTQEHLCPEGAPTNILEHKKRLWGLYELLDNHIQALFNDYTSFVVSVDEKLEYGKHDYLFKIDTIDPHFTREFHSFAILRKLIIPICRIEHHLAYENEIREEVAAYIEHINFLSDKITNPDSLLVLKLAKHKATFILKKLIRQGDSFEILVDCDRKFISRDALQELPPELNRFFHQYENVHEKQPYSDVEMGECQLRIHSRSDRFLDMALLMHYYCSTDKSIQQIDNLLAKFDETYDSLFHKRYKFKFDNHALCTLRNFMYNCRLSYKVRNNYTIEELRKDISDIEALQGITLVCNFYPYKKAVEFLIKTIQDNIEKRNIQFDYESNIALLESYLKKYDDNIEWCESHKFYPIQLPFKDCIVDVGGSKLIVPSTTTRPIDYKKLRENQISYHSSLEFFKTSQIYLKDQKDIQTVKDEVKNIEKRYLEIGGVLIGIVTFLLGTINIFTDNSASVQDMFRAIFGLGLLLVIFASLIVVILENYWNTETNKLRVCFFSAIIIVYTTISASLAFGPLFTKTNTLGYTSTSMVTDSIAPDTIKVGQDSLNRHEALKLRN